MRVVDDIGGFGKVTGVPWSAGSATLDAGRLAIMGMRRTLGSGDPERGHGLERGAGGLARAADAMAAASPGADWTGAAAEAYDRASRRQSGRAESMAALDRAAQQVLDRQGDRIVTGRTRLDGVSEQLAGLQRTARALAGIPGVGQAMRAQFEFATVTAALGAAGDELRDLTDLVSESTAALADIAGQYSSLAQAGAEEPGDGPDPDADDGPDDGWGGTGSPPVGVAVPPPPEAPTSPPVVGAAARPGATQPAGALPADAMSGLTGAMGAVGAMIGSAVTPLAAVLTGVAATVAESMSALAGPAEATDLEALAEEPADDAPTDRRPAESGSAADDPGGPERAGPGVESGVPAPSAPSADPESAAVPPAPIRPPQPQRSGDNP